MALIDVLTMSAVYSPAQIVSGRWK